MVNPLPLQFGLPGGPEVLIILLIAVLLFGANKIPKLARSTGEAMGEFQKGREEVEQELQEMREGPSSESPGPETTTEAGAETTTEAGAETTTEAGAETETPGGAAEPEREGEGEFEYIEDAETEPEADEETG